MHNKSLNLLEEFIPSESGNWNYVCTCTNYDSSPSEYPHHMISKNTKLYMGP